MARQRRPGATTEPAFSERRSTYPSRVDRCRMSAFRIGIPSHEILAIALLVLASVAAALPVRNRIISPPATPTSPRSPPRRRPATYGDDVMAAHDKALDDLESAAQIDRRAGHAPGVFVRRRDQPRHAVRQRHRLRPARRPHLRTPDASMRVVLVTTEGLADAWLVGHRDWWDTPAMPDTLRRRPGVERLLYPGDQRRCRRCPVCRNPRDAACRRRFRLRDARHAQPGLRDRGPGRDHRRRRRRGQGLSRQFAGDRAGPCDSRHATRSGRTTRRGPKRPSATEDADADDESQFDDFDQHLCRGRGRVPRLLRRAGRRTRISTPGSLPRPRRWSTRCTDQRGGVRSSSALASASDSRTVPALPA